MSSIPSKITPKEVAEQHSSLFNLKSFGINYKKQQVNDGKSSKLDLQGETNQK